jgi:2-oxoglutarate ferredoxin oxidoreductase subunit delta
VKGKTAADREDEEMTEKRAEAGSQAKAPEGACPAARRKPEFDISIFRSWCKDCGICVKFCKKNVFDQDVLGSPLITRPKDCNGCQECVLHCPDFAIQVAKKETKAGKE